MKHSDDCDDANLGVLVVTITIIKTRCYLLLNPENATK